MRQEAGRRMIRKIPGAKKDSSDGKHRNPAYPIHRVAP